MRRPPSTQRMVSLGCVARTQTVERPGFCCRRKEMASKVPTLAQVLGMARLDGA